MDFKAIRTLYAKMMYKIRRIFKKSPPPLDDIIEFLSCFSNTLRKKVDDCDSLTILYCVLLRTNVPSLMFIYFIV